MYSIELLEGCLGFVSSCEGEATSLLQLASPLIPPSMPAFLLTAHSFPPPSLPSSPLPAPLPSVPSPCSSLPCLHCCCIPWPILLPHPLTQSVVVWEMGMQHAGGDGKAVHTYSQLHGESGCSTSQQIGQQFVLLSLPPVHCYWSGSSMCVGPDSSACCSAAVQVGGWGSSMHYYYIPWPMLLYDFPPPPLKCVANPLHAWSQTPAADTVGLGPDPHWPTAAYSKWQHQW